MSDKISMNELKYRVLTIYGIEDYRYRILNREFPIVLGKFRVEYQPDKRDYWPGYYGHLLENHVVPSELPIGAEVHINKTDEICPEIGQEILREYKKIGELGEYEIWQLEVKM